MTSAIAWMLLGFAVSVNGINSIPIVERVELNETRGIRQMILWTHESTGGKYRSRVAQWWLVAAEPSIDHLDGWIVIQNRGVIFRTKRFWKTKTELDPEREDLKFLPEEYRVPYFPVCDLFTE